MFSSNIYRHSFIIRVDDTLKKEKKILSQKYFFFFFNINEHEVESHYVV